MHAATEISEQLRECARTADELHERSREMLVKAVREGALAGLTQRDIATAIGRSQPEVSRLLRFHGTSELGRRLARNRKKVLEAAAVRGIRNVRVFGSVARGTDRPDSDVDLLVDLPDGISLFTIVKLQAELADLLKANVDVAPASSLRANVASTALRDAVPL